MDKDNKQKFRKEGMGLSYRKIMLSVLVIIRGLYKQQGLSYDVPETP